MLGWIGGDIGYKLDNVDSAETHRGRTAVDVLPAVVGVGDVEVAGVFLRVAVGVANEGGLVLYTSRSGLIQETWKK